MWRSGPSGLTAYAETTDLNREELGTDRTLGIITSSTCYQYAREVFGPHASILKLGLVNPLPREKILAFAAKVDQVLVLEELDPVIETHCRNLGLTVLGKDRLPMVGEFSQGLVAQKIRDTARPWMELEENIPPRPRSSARDVPTGDSSTPWPNTRSRCWGHRLLYPGGL